MVLRRFSWGWTLLLLGRSQLDILQQLNEAVSVSLFVFGVQLAYQAWVTSTKTVLRKQRRQQKEELEADPAKGTLSPGETFFSKPSCGTTKGCFPDTIQNMNGERGVAS